jgi:hypothetical protein
MGKINLGRVILGGLVAGVVINLFEGVLNGVVLEKQWTEVLTGLGKSGTFSAKQIVAFNAWGFALGILTVWVYAALRPRFGAGPRTAVCSGLLIWALAYAMADAGPVFLHIFPVGMTLTTVAVEVVEMIAAGLAGAVLYKEESVGSPKLAAARGA